MIRLQSDLKCQFQVIKLWSGLEEQMGYTSSVIPQKTLEMLHLSGEPIERCESY